MAGLEVLVQLDLHVIELHLHAIEQGVVVGSAGGDLVQGVDHLDDAVQDALGHHQAQVAGGGGQGGGHEALLDALGGGPLAPDQVAEALDDDAAAQHVGQPGDALAVAVGILEGLGEVLGHQQGEVGILGVHGRVLIAVAVDGDDAVGILGDDGALRVHAEGADEILIFFGLVDDLALVQLVGQVLENFGGQLDAHADVDAVGLGLDGEVLTDALHPLAAAAADGDDALAAGVAAGVGDDLVAAVLGQDLAHGGAEVEIDLRLELGEEVFQHNEVDIRAEMADGGVEQVEAALQASGLEGAVGRRVELRVLAAVADVDLVDVVHEFHGLLLADVFVQRAAEVVRQIIFAVGERACAAEAVHDRAGRAADAVLDGLAVDGTSALFERLALFKHGDLLVRTEL